MLRLVCENFRRITVTVKISFLTCRVCSSVIFSKCDVEMFTQRHTIVYFRYFVYEHHIYRTATVWW